MPLPSLVLGMTETQSARGALALHLRGLIQETGPISLARFMAEAARHYYGTRDPFGREGDFTTAPEISQMFGELLGLWCVDCWTRLGRPSPVRVIELGPGRGTLMADALRVWRRAPEFLAAAQIYLVETSPVLQSLQKRRLANSGVTWCHDIASALEGPVLLLANEFFDALPVRQFQRRNNGWYERQVGTDSSGAFVFQLTPGPVPVTALLSPCQLEAALDAVVEVSPAAQAITAQIAAHIASRGGAALFIDYGTAANGVGDTLQALKAHTAVSPLDEPGDADITAHVDFQSLGQVARREGVGVFGPMAQGLFLRRLGIVERARHLKSHANAIQAEDMNAALHRLTDPSAMGHLFQVLALVSSTLGIPSGFEDHVR